MSVNLTFFRLCLQCRFESSICARDEIAERAIDGQTARIPHMKILIKDLSCHRSMMILRISLDISSLSSVVS